MAGGVNTPDQMPVRPPSETYEQVKARAQRILDMRGRPPYNNTSVPQVADGSIAGLMQNPFFHLSADELQIISEFVQFWLPFLVEKEKK